VLLQTFDAKAVALGLRPQLLLLAGGVADLALHGVHILSLFLEDVLKLLVARVVHAAARLHLLDFALQVVDLLEQILGFLVFLADQARQISPVLLLLHRHALELLELLCQLVSLFAHALELHTLGLQLLR